MIKRFNRRLHGVTLLEIMISVAVLAVGLGISFQVFPMGYALSSKSKNLSIAYELAAKRLEEARGRVLFGGNTKGSEANSERSYYGNLRAPNPDESAETAYSSVNTNGQFIPCGADGTPESYFYYKVDCVPVIDSRCIYAEYPHYYKDDNSFRPDSVSNASTKWTNNAYNNGNKLAGGFASMYRITVTVRGPFPLPSGSTSYDKLSAGSTRAADAVVNNLRAAEKNAMSEATLSTIVSNSKLGDGLLAKDIILRNPNVANASGLGIRYQNKDASGNNIKNNIIYVKGYGGTGTSLHAENFTMLFTPNLSQLELDDTGPTIVSKAAPVGASTPLTDLTQILDRGKIDESFHTNNPHYVSNFGESQPAAAKNQSLSDGTYCATNLYNMDNIVICCPTLANTYTHSKCSYTNGGWVAESNKLWRMTPPNAAGNTESYWKFELVNELFGRDGDYTTSKARSDGTGALAREGLLMDRVFDGDILLSSGMVGYPAGSGSGSAITGTRVRSLVTIESGLKSKTVYVPSTESGVPTAASGLNNY